MYHKWQPYDIWFLRYEPSNTDFFVILGHFLPLTSPKIKIFNKIKNKNTKRYNHFTQVEPKIMIICYTVSEIWHVTDVTFIFHFCLFFALLPPYSLKTEKFKKMKTRLEILHRFTQVYQKSWSNAILFLRHGAWLM